MIGMGLAALIFTAIGLSMDAFAASICQGLRMPKLRWGRLVVIGLYFGALQALMPLLSWRLGIEFSAYIRAFDHWAAFLLLVLLGRKMLWGTLRADADAAEIETAVQKPPQAAPSGSRHVNQCACGRCSVCVPGGCNFPFSRHDRRHHLHHFLARRLDRQSFRASLPSLCRYFWRHHPNPHRRKNPPRTHSRPRLTAVTATARSAGAALRIRAHSTRRPTCLRSKTAHTPSPACC